MGVVKLPRIYMYWATHPIFAGTQIYDRTVMSRARYFNILKFLRFGRVANQQGRRDPKDRLEHFLELLRQKMKTLVDPGLHIAIDEALILWKGKLFFKQFIKTKRSRFGVKIFFLCPGDPKWQGLSFNFELYYGQNDDLHMDVAPAGLSKSENIVVYLMEGLLDEGRHCVTDNWYTSQRLASYLETRNTTITGTINVQRGVPDQLVASHLAKHQTAYMRKDNNLFVKYEDKKSVYILTTRYMAGEEVDERFSFGARQQIRRPTAIASYNNIMGGVDKADQWLEYYDCNRKSFAWFKKIGIHFIERMCLNSYVIYKNKTPNYNYDYMHFLMKVVEGLIDEHSPRGHVMLDVYRQAQPSRHRGRKAPGPTRSQLRVANAQRRALPIPRPDPHPRGRSQSPPAPAPAPTPAPTRRIQRAPAPTRRSSRRRAPGSDPSSDTGSDTVPVPVVVPTTVVVPAPVVIPATVSPTAGVMPQGPQALPVASPEVSRALRQQSSQVGSPSFAELQPRPSVVPSVVQPAVQPAIPSPVPSHGSSEQSSSSVPSHGSSEQSSSSVDNDTPRYHQLTAIPGTDTRKYPQKKCRQCTFNGNRKDVRAHCELCPGKPGLCKGRCFNEYHARVGITTHAITPPVAHRTRAGRNRRGNVQPRQRGRGFQGGRDQRGQYKAGPLPHSSSPDDPERSATPPPPISPVAAPPASPPADNPEQSAPPPMSPQAGPSSAPRPGPPASPAKTPRKRPISPGKSTTRPAKRLRYDPAPRDAQGSYIFGSDAEYYSDFSDSDDE